MTMPWLPEEKDQKAQYDTDTRYIEKRLAELEKELMGLKATPDGNAAWVLEGVPKGLEQRVSALKITAGADGTIRSMTIEETDGVTNRFEFSGEAGNVPASNAEFVFTPPAGVHVVEGEPPV